MVSGKMELSKATLFAGLTSIKAQRGTDTWGANYVFNPSGIQNDILVISDALSGIQNGENFISAKLVTPTVSGAITLGASGTTTIGSQAKPLALSGIYMQGAGGAYRLFVAANGAVSGALVV